MAPAHQAVDLVVLYKNLRIPTRNGANLMTDLLKPSIQALLVCDTVIEDIMTRKKSLIGLFTHLQAPVFPFQHPQLGLYFCLTDAQGTYQFDIDLVYLNSDELVAKASLPGVEIADRLQISDFGVNIPALVFPAPGRYEFRLSVNRTVIAQKDFHVVQAALPPSR